jgi:hypothetical protein
VSELSGPRWIDLCPQLSSLGRGSGLPFYVRSFPSWTIARNASTASECTPSSYRRLSCYSNLPPDFCVNVPMDLDRIVYRFSQASFALMLILIAFRSLLVHYFSNDTLLKPSVGEEQYRAIL